MRQLYANGLGMVRGRVERGMLDLDQMTEVGHLFGKEIGGFASEWSPLQSVV